MLKLIHWLVALVVGFTAATSSAQSTVPCSSADKLCLPIVVHMVHEAPGAVVTPAWLTMRIAEANRLFSPVGVAFYQSKQLVEHASFADIQTRSHRNALGHSKTSPGAVHLFVVRRLADVDIANTVIRGVHWREQTQSGARWIILSSIAPPLVLAHELGHYFGLPHSKDGRSIMNKQKGGGRPPWSERTFLKPEHETMKAARDKMLGSGWLVALARGKFGQ